VIFLACLKTIINLLSRDNYRPVLNPFVEKINRFTSFHGSLSARDPFSSNDLAQPIMCNPSRDA